jgi:hypothetical protein
MATELLVSVQIDEGERLIRQLLLDGFEVAVAFWVRTSDEGLWHLYIASPSTDAQRIGEAYRRVYASLSRIPGSSISPSDIKLISDRNPIARDAAQVRDRYPAKTPTRYQGNKLGDLSIGEAYIYSPPDPEKIWLRHSFSVKYVRDGETNNWRATVNRGELYRGIKAKGAVSYTSFLFTGEQPEDQNFAIVNVLVEVDPKLDEESILDHPGIIRMLAEQAGKLADEWFRSRHPDAIITHHEEDNALASGDSGMPKAPCR